MNVWRTSAVRKTPWRSISFAWYPRLLRATPDQREQWRVSGGGYGIHWPELDEDLSTEGLLRGAPAQDFTPAASGQP